MHQIENIRNTSEFGDWIAIKIAAQKQKRNITVWRYSEVEERKFFDIAAEIKPVFDSDENTIHLLNDLMIPHYLNLKTFEERGRTNEEAYENIISDEEMKQMY